MVERVEHRPVLRVADVMTSRLRQEDGFTLPELLITLVIGLTVSLATFSLIEVVMRRSGQISARIEAVQSGRTAMDTMTRELRSTVCIPRTTNPAILPVAIDAAGPNTVTLYTDLRDNSNRLGGTATPTPAPGTISGPDKRQLTYVPNPAPATTGKIIETTWKPTSLVNGVYAYGGAPTSRELLTSVERAKAADGTPVPVFQFFKYDFVADAAEGLAAQPDHPVTNGVNLLTADQIKNIAKVKITYKSNPARKRADGSAATVFTNEVFTRNVDPNAETDELSEPCK